MLKSSFLFISELFRLPLQNFFITFSQCLAPGYDQQQCSSCKLDYFILSLTIHCGHVAESMQIGNIANTFAEIASFFEFVLGRILNHSSCRIVLLLVTLLSDLFAFITTLNQKNSKFPSYTIYMWCNREAASLDT